MSSRPLQPNQKLAQAHLNLDELADDREEWEFFSEASEATRITDFVDIDLSAEREAIASELEVLRSIYGAQAIRVLQPSHDSDASPSLQYEVDTR